MTEWIIFAFMGFGFFLVCRTLDKIADKVSYQEQQLDRILHTLDSLNAAQGVAEETFKEVSRLSKKFGL